MTAEWALAEAKLNEAETIEEALAWLKPKERMALLQDRALIARSIGSAARKERRGAFVVGRLSPIAANPTRASPRGLGDRKRDQSVFEAFRRSVACAAASRAIGTRNGEQET